MCAPVVAALPTILPVASGIFGFMGEREKVKRHNAGVRAQYQADANRWTVKNQLDASATRSRQADAKVNFERANASSWRAYESAQIEVDDALDKVKINDEEALLAAAQSEGSGKIVAGGAEATGASAARARRIKTKGVEVGREKMKSLREFKSYIEKQQRVIEQEFDALHGRLQSNYARAAKGTRFLADLPPDRTAYQNRLQKSPNFLQAMLGIGTKIYGQTAPTVGGGPQGVTNTQDYNKAADSGGLNLSEVSYYSNQRLRTEDYSWAR